MTEVLVRLRLWYGDACNDVHLRHMNKVAEQAARGKGIGKEALYIMMNYGMKINANNIALTLSKEYSNCN